MADQSEPFAEILGIRLSVDEIANPQLRRAVRERIRPRGAGVVRCQQYPDREYREYNEYQGEYSEYWESSL